MSGPWWEAWRRRACGMLLGCWAGCGCATFSAEEVAAAPRGAPPITYRRIFVPEQDPSAWPTGGDKLFPVATRDFETWLAAANRIAASREPAATIAEASYTARWDGERLVDGDGKWTIRVPGETAALVDLADTSLVIHDAQWLNDAAMPVRLGTWGRSGGLATRRGVEAATSGVLTFRWQVPTPSTAGDSATIDWRLPPAAVTRVVLELPAGMRPTWEGSLVLRCEELADEKNATTTDGGPDGRTGPPHDADRWRRWELAAGPASSTTMRIVAAESEPAPRLPTLLLREQAKYDVSERGLDVEAQLHLTGPLNQLRQLSIPLPAGVQLVSATLDDRELSWRSAAAGSVGRALVQLPERSSAAEEPAAITIVLRAWQAAFIDEAWSLPRLLPEDVFWTAGSLQVSLSPGLELRSLAPVDCVQTSVGQEDGVGNGAATCSFAAYTPRGAVELVVGMRPADVAVRMGTALEVRNTEIAARCMTRVDVLRGSVHKLSGEVPAAWMVDTVETVPSDALGEWYLDDREGQRHIDVQLSAAARPERPVTVVVTGRMRPRRLDEPMAVERMQPVRWQDVKVARDLLLVQAIEPYAVEPVGERTTLLPTALAAADRALFASEATGIVFDAASSAGRAVNGGAIRRTLKRGRYTAEVVVDATLTGRELRQSCRVIVEPQTSGVDHVLVASSRPLPGDVRWTAGPSGTVLSAERLAKDDPRRGRLPATAELWQLHLPRRQSSTMEIIATSSAPVRGTRSLTLYSLPEAIEQSGRVLLRVEGASAPQVTTRGMRAIPVPISAEEDAEGGARRPVWAAFRYDPADCQEAARQPALQISSDAGGAGGATLFARRVELESFFSADGEILHRTIYHVENPWETSELLRLPTGVEVISAAVDRRTVELTATDDGAGPVSIALPAARRATVTLCLAARQLPLAPGRRLTPPPLIEGMPILCGEWTIWLPAEFTVPEMEAVTTANGEGNWRSRLFGPLGRPEGERPFDPLRSSTWSALVTRWSEEAPSAVSKPPRATIRGRHDGVGSSVAGVAPWGESEATAASMAGGRGGSQTALLGWRPFQQRFAAGRPRPVVVTQPPATTAWSIAVFMVCLLGGARLAGRRNVSWYIGLTASAAVLSLLLPPAFSPLATGALLGMLASLVVNWPREPDHTEAPTKTWTRLVAAGTSTALAIVLLCAEQALAQANSPTAPDPPADAATIHRVFIPVDASRRPAGDRLYVSERLLRELLPLANSKGSSSGEWIVLGGLIRGELRARSEDSELAAGPWRMTLEVEVLGRDTEIVLPLVREEATWSATVLADGVPLPLIWRADGRSCAITVAEPGRYEMSISFTPRVRTLAGENHLELTVPPIAGAALELTHSAEASGLKVAGVDSGRRGSRQGGVLRYQLDGSGRLVVGWPARGTTAGVANVPLTELRWLRLDGEGARLEVKYVSPAGGPLPPTMVVSADRRWELISAAEQRADVQVDEFVNDRRTVRIALGPAAVRRGELTLAWRLVDAATLGRVRLPTMELSSPATGPSWLAISGPRSLEYALVDAVDLTPETADEFARLWGVDPGVELPQLVVGNVSAGGALTVAVQPRLGESSIDEVLHVAAGAAGLRIQYQAEVAPIGRHRFGFPITVPSDAVVEDVTVTQATRPVRLRWVRSGANHLNVFFSEELTEPYRLVVTAHAATDGSSEYALPRMLSSGTLPAVERVQIYREPPVQVAVRGPMAADDAAPDLPPVPWNARLLSAYQLDPDVAEQVRLVVSPNRVETEGETLTLLERSDESWWATWVGRLTVRQGELDTLRLRVPKAWSGPYRVQPAGVVASVVAGPNGDEAILSLDLPRGERTGRRVAVEVRGPLATAGGAPPVVPVIMPETRARWPSYVAVPTRLDGQSFTWTTEAVEPSELPRSLRARGRDNSAARIYRVTSWPYRVALAPPRLSRPWASVRLADTVVLRSRSGTTSTATRFVLAPQTLSDVELAIPADADLVTVELDGRPARMRRLENGRWVVSLGPSELPQVLDVVTSDAVGAGGSGGRFELSRPRLWTASGELPVEVGLWAFNGEWPSDRPRIDGASLVTWADQAALRLDRLVSIAEAATPTVMSLPLADAYDWFRPWAGRLAAAADEARTALERAGHEGAPARVGPNDEQLTEATQRIDAWKEGFYEWLEWPDVEEPDDLPFADRADRSLLDDNRNDAWFYCIADGSADRIGIELIGADSPPGPLRVWGVLAIVGAAVALAWMAREPAAHDLWFRWPHVFGVLGGLAWWAWLWPSWLGALLVAASLWLMLRPGWPSRPLRSDGSTVLQIGRPH